MPVSALFRVHVSERFGHVSEHLRMALWEGPRIMHVSCCIRQGVWRGLGGGAYHARITHVSACSHARREGTRVSGPYHRVSACIMVRVSWVVYRVWGSRIIALYRVVS